MNYGESHYVPIERAPALWIQPVTAIKVKTNEHELQPTTIDVAKSQDINEVKLANTTTPWVSQEMQYDESTVEMGIVKPKSVGMTIQEIKPSRNMKLSELQIYDPEDVDIFYDALSHLDYQGQVSKDYEDNFSLQDSTKVTAMEAAHPVGTKRNQKQHRGHQASRKQKTSLNLTAIELQQLRPYTKYKKQQIPSKKPQLYKRIKRADIDAINVKIKNYKPLWNLLRLLVHYII